MPTAPEQARLFVALELPAEIVAALGAWSRVQLSRHPGLRLISADSLHVTLCFLGSRPIGEVGEIATACRDGAGGRGEITLGLGQPVWLPRRRPRVLAVELHDTDGSLSALQSELARTLHDAGAYELDSRPYLGHVTVARVRRPWPRTAPELPPAPEPLSFRAGRVTLFESRLGAGPARYEGLETVTLAAD
ncbi:MAG: RNA 2',3'-cyclic phosphodiesterase [Solirubrobacteraceae bacterium]